MAADYQGTQNIADAGSGDHSAVRAGSRQDKEDAAHFIEAVSKHFRRCLVNIFVEHNPGYQYGHGQSADTVGSGQESADAGNDAVAGQVGRNRCK